MAQLSRTYQVVLLGVVVLAAAWLVLLQGHSSSPSSSGAGSSAPAVQTVTTTTVTPAKHSPTGASKVYQGSAPGVSGLTKAVAKAQGAVATSTQNAKTLEQKSAQASNESAATTHSTSSATVPAPAKALTKSPSAVNSTPTTATKSAPTKPAAPNASTRSTIAVNQRLVEAQLAKGKIAVILFWDPRGADDVSVRHAVQQLAGNSRLKVAVSYAKAGQVASFGSITRGIQVYGTPTILIVNKKGTTTTLTGLQDAFAIQQAVSEARHS